MWGVVDTQGDALDDSVPDPVAVALGDAEMLGEPVVVSVCVSVPLPVLLTKLERESECVTERVRDVQPVALSDSVPDPLLEVHAVMLSVGDAELDPLGERVPLPVLLGEPVLESELVGERVREEHPVSLSDSVADPLLDAQGVLVRDGLADAVLDSQGEVERLGDTEPVGLRESVPLPLLLWVTVPESELVGERVRDVHAVVLCDSVPEPVFEMDTVVLRDGDVEPDALGESVALPVLLGEPVLESELVGERVRDVHAVVDREGDGEGLLEVHAVVLSDGDVEPDGLGENVALPLLLGEGVTESEFVGERVRDVHPVALSDDDAELVGGGMTLPEGERLALDDRLALGERLDVCVTEGESDSEGLPESDDVTDEVGERDDVREPEEHADAHIEPERVGVADVERERVPLPERDGVAEVDSLPVSLSDELGDCELDTDAELERESEMLPVLETEYDRQLEWLRVPLGDKLFEDVALSVAHADEDEVPEGQADADDE